MYILDNDVMNLINGTSHRKHGIEQEGQRRSLKDGVKCLKGFSLDEKPSSFPTVQGVTIPICQFDPKTSKVYEFATFFMNPWKFLAMQYMNLHPRKLTT